MSFECFPNRQRSYSATDIRGNSSSNSQSSGRLVAGGGIGSVSSLIDLPVPSASQPVYGNITNGPTSDPRMSATYENMAPVSSIGHGSSQLRVPVRPSPAPPISAAVSTPVTQEQLHSPIYYNSMKQMTYSAEDSRIEDEDDDDDWDTDTIHQTSQDAEVDPDPFDTSHLRFYDEPPVEASLDGPQFQRSPLGPVSPVSNISSHDWPNTVSASDVNNYSSPSSDSVNPNPNLNPMPVLAPQFPSPGNQQVERFNDNNNSALCNQISNMWINKVGSPTTVQVPTAISGLTPIVPPPSVAVSKTSPNTLQNIKKSEYRSDLSLNEQNPTRTTGSIAFHNNQPLMPSKASESFGSNTFSDDFYEQKSATLPKLNSSFIAELEKSLGQAQASANTFKEKDTNAQKVLSPLTPNKSVSTSRINQLENMNIRDQSSRSTINQRTNNDNHTQLGSNKIQNETLSNIAMFSDLDVMSSSKTLGLLPQNPIDTGKYFPKTAHVKPFVHSQVQHTTTSTVPTCISPLWSSTMLEPIQNPINSPVNKPSSNNPTWTTWTSEESEAGSQTQGPQMSYEVHQTINNSSKSLNSPHQHNPQLFYSQNTNTASSQSWYSKEQHYNHPRPTKTSPITTNTPTLVQPTVVLSPQLTVNYNQV